VSIFTDTEPDSPRRRPGAGWIGWSLLTIATAAVVVVALLPSPYVVEQPGPAFDTLGTVTIDDAEVPLIDIPTETTYPTTGALDMLTVSIVGNRDSPLNWFEAATAWLDKSKAVVPIDSIYPVGVTVEQSSEESRIQMEVSQQEAIAAALAHLDYDFDSTLTVEGFLDGSPAEGTIEVGDQVVSLNGETFNYVSQMRAALAKNGIDKPATVVVIRDGKELTLEVTPVLSEEETPAPVIGILMSSEYKFPFDVTIQLENVGGPSAGQMFALGIIDKLTKGELNGGQKVAGTGTITGEGQIGAIGGIRQKMYGALGAGATYFLAPASNCNEVTGHIPDGLTVLSVETLDDSLAALDGIASGDVDGLPVCPVS
jgi:PDZ domain-containing protein